MGDSLDSHLRQGRPTLPATQAGRSGESPFLNFVLPEETVRAANAAAEAAGVNRSIWMRSVLAHALEQRPKLEVTAMRAKTRSKNVNLRWTPEGIAAIHAFAAELGKTRSATIRTIIEHALS